MNCPGRIMLPKRWSRAKRKRMRRGVQWLRRIELPYKRMLAQVWRDENETRAWASFMPPQPPIGEVLDAQELRLR